MATVPVHRASSHYLTAGATTATNHAVPKPTGVVDGDLLVVFAHVREVAASIVIDAPAGGGWTEILAEVQGSVGSMTSRAWAKIASSEPSTWTFTTSTAQEAGFTCHAVQTGTFDASSIANAIPVKGTNSTSGTAAAASVTISAPDADCLMVLHRGVKDNAASTTFTASGATATERLDQQAGDVGAAYWNVLHIADSNGAVGSTGNKTATSTHSASPQGSITFAYFVAPATSSPQTLNAEAVALTLTPREAPLLPGAVLLVAEAVALALTPREAPLLPGVLLAVAERPALTLTAIEAPLLPGVALLAAERPALVLTPAEAALLPGAVTLAAEWALLALAATEAPLIATVTLPGEAVSLVLTATEAALVATATLAAERPGLTLTAIEAPLLPGALTLDAERPELVLTALEAPLLAGALLLAAERPALILTALEAALGAGGITLPGEVVHLLLTIAEAALHAPPPNQPGYASSVMGGASATSVHRVRTTSSTMGGATATSSEVP